MKRVTSESEQDTQAVGTEIGRIAGPGCFIALFGDLGTGKSVLARGVARGLGIAEAVPSPTFTLLNIYPEGRLPLYHFDVYRLGSEDELEALGYEDCFFGAGVTVLEWPQRITGLLPQNRLDVTLAAGQAPRERIICLMPRGEEAENMLKEARL